MLKVAVCDDDAQMLTDLAALLGRYQQEKRIVITVDAFTSAVELLNALRTKDYDFLILDILMPGLTGMQAAREIRTYNTHMSLLFLTSSPEFAVESYSVDAFSYLLKPVNESNLFPVLDRLMKRLLRSEEALTLASFSGIVRLPFSAIEFMDVNSKHLRFFMEDGTIREIPGSLSEYEPRLLCRSEFFKVHRSYIVNFSHVQSLDTKELTTYSGKKIPVARALVSQVRQKYTDFLFEEDG